MKKITKSTIKMDMKKVTETSKEIRKVADKIYAELPNHMSLTMNQFDSLTGVLLMEVSKNRVLIESLKIELEELKNENRR